MTGEPFILPEYANQLTENERGLVLAVIAQMLAKREEDAKSRAPVFDLRKYRADQGIT